MDIHTRYEYLNRLVNKQAAFIGSLEAKIKEAIKTNNFKELEEHIENQKYKPDTKRDGRSN